MPAFVKETELKTLQEKAQATTRERMLREMAEAVETLSAESGLVLVLEDLHWSDSSTLELIAYLAQRRMRARLLVIGTYRPTEVIIEEHPLKGIKQELQARAQCTELRLELLTEEEIEEYVTKRFPQSTFPADLARVIHRRTDGNALFMVNVVEELISQGMVSEQDGHWELQVRAEDVEGEVPENLRQIIGKQIERLGAQEQRLLEVASVAGAEFAAATVAVGLQQDAEEVEAVCEDLAWKEQFLKEVGVVERPDGTISGQYAFQHALYQNVLYDRVARARRVRLHRQIGDREETSYGERAGEIAAELAVHFERGRDLQRAVHYCKLAGENALKRNAHTEAIRHLKAGIALLHTLPVTLERTEQELAMQLSLGTSLQAVKSYTAPDVERAYSRARELCQQLGEPPQLFQVLFGLRGLYFARAEHQIAHELGEQLLRIAKRTQDSVLLLEAHVALVNTCLYRGQLSSANAHIEQAMQLYDPGQQGSYAFVYSLDPGVFCTTRAAEVLCLFGYPEQAQQQCAEALRLGEALSHPFTRCHLLANLVFFYQLCRDVLNVQKWAEEATRYARDQGFPFWITISSIWQGWALAVQGDTQEGIARLRRDVDAYQKTGAGLMLSYFMALLAEAYGRAGRAEEGLTVLDEALTAVESSDERFYEAELYRLKGELILKDERRMQNAERRKKTPTPSSVHHSSFIIHRFAEGEACFQRALEIARQQQAKALELRAAISLARLWQQQGKQTDAQELLAPIYHWFTEGFATTDLKEAKALLDQLDQQASRQKPTLSTCGATSKP